MLKNKLEFINKKVDEIALRTRLEVEGEHLKRIKCVKTIRIYTTFTDECLKINTRVLNDLYNDDKTGFWTLVKRVCVAFNTDICSDAQEYNSSNVNFLNDSHLTDLGCEQKEKFEALEWNERSGDAFLIPLKKKYKNIQILIKLRNERQVFKLSVDLRELLNKFTETKNGVIKDLYRYFNTNNIIDYNTSEIKCDEKLERIFNVKSFNMANINQLIENHLHPIGYCVININPSDKSEETNIWDINMEVDDLSQFPILYPEAIYQLERKIEDNRALKLNLQERVAVIEEFVEDPALFINRKIALDSNGIGTKTAFYDELSVQTALYELIKKQE